MTVWYALEGEIKVKLCPEVREIVERFNQEIGSDEDSEQGMSLTDESGGVGVIHVQVGDTMSSSATSCLDDIIQELGPWVLEPDFLACVYDDNHGRLYVGPREREAAAESRWSLAEIERHLPSLTAADRDKLVTRLDAFLKDPCTDQRGHKLGANTGRGPGPEPNSPLESTVDLNLLVPTYYGDSTPGKEEFDEPNVPVVIFDSDGIRIVLGTHDRTDLTKPDVQIERRPGGWAIFLHPLGGGDPSGAVYFLDDGRSYVQPERDLGTTDAIEVLEHDGELPPELDKT